jgi:uncharacterized protein
MTQLMPGVKREDLAAADDPAEGTRVAEEATRRLEAVYGARLRQVILFGSWVRGEAHEKSDVDVLVVLDEIASRGDERNRIVGALFDLAADSKRAIEAFHVGDADARERVALWYVLPPTKERPSDLGARSEQCFAGPRLRAFHHQ